ncbi:3-oxoacyl-[acyl-carrier protein] reductase [Butyrivibrio sp. ob235]|uniref:elongation factor P 5-aminopentanone reductase n=1 Tax=Butyrivibrio sp. ob235 TaxID=1761780 RepID=UPI0008CFBE87|nr:3-oxoacyl-ACP reductase FabG [Butyrivibrio sp. ob235]SEK66657.1 3-oxoacyl-[acyl-carrier protein] reductase [Butyrivibrio sp. ob235]
MHSNKGTVLITGASRGIGKAIAEAFAKEGYNLFLCCKNNIDSLTAFAESLASTCGIIAETFRCDVSDEKSVSLMFEKMNTMKTGSPQIVVNNAGIAWYGLLTDMTSDEWHDIIGTNLDSVFYICKNAVPHMLQSGEGRIINISSVWGNVGASCEVAYSASKGGVNSFTKALAKELAPSNIPVNAISCGVIDTEMNSSHLSEEELMDLASEIPADRLGKPEEVAELAVNLATAPKYMTGQVITIDGGWI